MIICLRGANSGEIMVTLLAETEAKVLEWQDKVREKAGGRILRKAERDKNDYYGGFAFADPDGYRFNVLLLENGM